MSASIAQLCRNPGFVSAQENEFHFFAHAKSVAICLLQCRTSDDGTLFGDEAALDQLPQLFEPRLPIFIREGNAFFHFLDVRSWMKIIGLIEFPVQFFC